MKIYLTLTALLFSVLSWAQDPIDTEKIWTLEDCITYAIENNITVKEAVLTKELTEVSYMESKSSRLPNLYSTASQNFTNGNTIDPITSEFVSQQINSTSLSLNTSMTLFSGNQINNQIKQSKLLVDQYHFFEEESKNDITLSILEGYIQLMYLTENINVAENNLEYSTKEEERAKALYDAGSLALKDYTDVKSQMATNSYNLTTAKNDYDLQLLTFKQLLELPPETNIKIDENLDYLTEELADVKSIYDDALATLPEIRASETNLLVSEKALDIEKGAYLPTLSLTGSLGSGYTSTQDLSFTNQFDGNFNQQVGLSLYIPIFNRNSTKASVQSAKINIDIASLDLLQEKKDLYVKVETAWLNANATQKQMYAAEVAKEAAEQSYDLAKKQYDLGALSSTDLIISQNTYTNAEQNYLQAKYLNLLYTELLQFYQGNEIKI
ncbi:TolC family protein [Cellulophaga baltica]|uniref:TolC family protein n=1 Tax=Cellulophaga TaxID=104264 RepID=UPI001C06B7BB|nr:MULTISPECIES: TolC family protein [Cellulophaga]MBU2996283.1 TolC family protein [Cellulophaga baltica]MDO6767678.1 TolC family protein [Cellulophaga sp. 1_MG-2023]